jgi:hypothetical protein
MSKVVIVVNKKSCGECGHCFLCDLDGFWASCFSSASAETRLGKTYLKVPTLYKKEYEDLYKEFDKERQRLNSLLDEEVDDDIPTLRQIFADARELSSFFNCCFCRRDYGNYGHNPAPLTNDPRQRCCESCNSSKVLPERIARIQKKEEPTKTEEKKKAKEADRKARTVASTLSRSKAIVETPTKTKEDIKFEEEKARSLKSNEKKILMEKEKKAHQDRVKKLEGERKMMEDKEKQRKFSEKIKKAKTLNLAFAGGAAGGAKPVVEKRKANRESTNDLSDEEIVYEPKNKRDKKSV